MPHLRTLLLGAVALAGSISNASLLPRDSNQTCTGLEAQSNNGDRKIAIVIDSSSSMSSSDPYDLRIAAGRNILDWLISKKEASGAKKADSVTVIDFASSASLDYALGDPEGAYDALGNITTFGGTYIASGVKMAIAQLTAGGTGGTADRSGIIVFTDGEDGNIAELVNEIDRASSSGIRVSFGFLSGSTSLQNKRVVSAIMNSGGFYSTIGSAQASNNFINGFLVNGLTKNDNAKGDDSILLADLDTSHFISGSETQKLTYYAREKEHLNVTVQSMDSGSLNVQVLYGSKVLATENNLLFSQTMNVVSPGTGNIDVKVSARNAPKNSIFIVGVESDLPLQNCTVAIGGGGGGGGGKNKAVIVGPTVGIGLALVLGGLGYLCWKYFHGKSPPPLGNPGAEQFQYAPGKEGAPQVTTAPLSSPPPSQGWFKEYFGFPDHGVPPPLPPPPPQYPATSKNAPPQGENSDNNIDYESGSEWEEVEDHNDGPAQGQDPNQAPTDPADKKKPRHIQRVRIYGNNHHHHLPPGHACHNDECPLVLPGHVCNDPAHPCTCVDPKCKLNSRRHRCKENSGIRHQCLGPKENPNCPLNDPAYMEAKKKEHSELVRKYMAQDAALSGIKMAATYGIKGLGVI